MGKSNYMNRMRQYKKGSFVKKYQPGGMLMYGDPKLGNQTFANMVYEESDPAKQEMLAQQMQQTVNDTSGIEQAEQQGMRVQNTASGIESGIGQGLTTGIAQLAKSGATGKLATAASKASAYNPYAIGANILGSGISAMSNDNDATTLNFGEGFGTALSNAGTGASIGSMILPGVGTLVGAGLGAAYGLGRGIYQRNRARRNIGSAEQERENKIGMLGARTRREGVLSREYSGYDFGRTLAKHGGVRLPGGTMNPIPGSDAVEFKGKSHKQGGILLDEQTEVEGGETMDKVTMKNEGPSDYFFSKYLKLGGKSYAQRHKDILKKGGTQQDIDALAMSQEKTAGRNPRIIQMMQTGGVRKYQTAGAKEDLSIPSTAVYGDDTGEYGSIPGYQPGTMVNGMMMYGDPNDPEFQELIKSEEFGENWINNADPEILKAAGITSFEDMSDSSKVRKYQQEWNKRNEDNRVIVDGKFGEQTVRTATGRTASKNSDKGSEPSAADSTPVTLTNKQGTLISPNTSLPKFDFPISPEVQKLINSKIDITGSNNSSSDTSSKQKFPYGALAAGFGQLIPPIATFATKENPITMGPTGRIGKPVLDRVDYNDERMSNTATNRAISKGIDTQGMGPASVISKMAAYGRKQAGDMKIAGAEDRANTQIDVTEKQMGQSADMFNVQNAMRADMYNTGILEQGRKDQLDRRFAAVDAFADRTAGLYGDYLSYKGQERLAQAIGDQGIYEADLALTAMMKTKNPATGKNYTRAEAKALLS
jgi:hypothetical protein